MKARIVNDTVVEILTPIAGFRIEDCFHPDILAQCVDVTEGMQVGDTYPPVVEEVVEETPPEEPSAPV
jgi:hypothetical protein